MVSGSSRDQITNSPVEVVEEGHKEETELDKALLLVTRQRAEDLSRVVHVVLAHDPGLSAALP